MARRFMVRRFMVRRFMVRRVAVRRLMVRRFAVRHGVAHRWMGLACPLVIVAAGLLAGCGTSDVAPRTWAKSVCSALTPWRTRVADLTGQARQEISKSATPTQTRQSLVTLLGGAEKASDQARRRVLDAGVPDVDGGEKTADRFVTALTRARDAYGRTKTTIAKLDASQDKRFYDGVEQAFGTLNKEYSASALDIDTVGPAPLHNAFNEVPECR